jgi:hypothetical protein
MRPTGRERAFYEYKCLAFGKPIGGHFEVSFSALGLVTEGHGEHQSMRA